MLEALRGAVSKLGVAGVEPRLERPRDPSHGDLTSNVAMVVAGRLKRPPRDVAQALAGEVEGLGGIASVEVAGPGFLNFRFDQARAGAHVAQTRAGGARYGATEEGAGNRVMVEFVSANPTGPLHLGHGRQAALGDAIASLLEWTGWEVHREFYFNDAGKQMERLAASVWARYQQALGESVPVPEDGYQGDYVAEIAADFRAVHGDQHRGDRRPETLLAMQQHAVSMLRAEQVRDLEGFGVHFDEFYRESSLYEDGRLEATIAGLRETGLTYEEDGATWLKTTEYGDQKDRVMLKSDGSPTYFLPDVAYHVSKWDRGFQHVINVQGSDHHGTVDRVRAGLQALGKPAGYPEYVLHQMVAVERGGEQVRLSKRAGSFDTMGELVAQVGVDVARYFFLMRRPEAHLTFDLDVALDQSDKNPVYKVQYAHARMCSIFRKAGAGAGAEAEGTPEPDTLSDAEVGADTGPAFRSAALDQADLSLLATEAEQGLANRLSEFPEVVSRAARDRAPHLLCDYLERTAGMVNSWYHAGNPSRNPELAVLVPDPALSAARLALVDAVRIVLRNGLSVLGLNAPTRMDRPE